MMAGTIKQSEPILQLLTIVHGMRSSGEEERHWMRRQGREIGGEKGSHWSGSGMSCLTMSPKKEILCPQL
eukprot:588180-Karenia_brevis.AAC.1